MSESDGLFYKNHLDFDDLIYSKESQKPSLKLILTLLSYYKINEMFCILWRNDCLSLALGHGAQDIVSSNW